MTTRIIALFVSLLLLAPPMVSPAAANDRPFKLRLQTWVDQGAWLASPREIPFADVVVLRLEDREVRLHFAVGTDPQPPAAPVAFPVGRALVTVHMRQSVTPIP